LANIYIKTNEVGAVTDYLKSNDDSEYSFKLFDDFKPDSSLIDQGYIYVHLINIEYPLFEKLHDYYTYYVFWKTTWLLHILWPSVTPTI